MTGSLQDALSLDVLLPSMPRQRRSAPVPLEPLDSVLERLAPTEVDLLTTASSGRIVSLRSDWAGILGDLFSLGRVRALTAGASAFIERSTPYPLPELSPSLAVSFGETMELRHDLTEWGRAFAVFSSGSRTLNSPGCALHFFDKRGIAVHRVFLTSSSSIEAFERIADEYSLSSGANSAPNDGDASPSGIVCAKFARSASDRLVRRVQSYEILRALHNCHQECTETRITIANAGSMQTYRGVLREVRNSDHWTCIAGDDTTVYIRDSDIAETWVMESGIEEVKSSLLIAFAADGRAIVSIGGDEFDRLRSNWRWHAWLEGLPDV